jgi:two-component system NarL family sensor kinase
MESTDDPAAAFDEGVSELKRLAEGLLREREAERSRLAARLGSRIASPVVIAKYMIEDAMQRLDGDSDPNSVELLNGARGGLRQVLNEVASVSTELRPSMLDDLGLLPTIEWYCRTFERAHRLNVVRQLYVDESQVADDLKLPIFRFVEETLGNVARHAHASRVEVLLTRVSDGLLLCVQDNGEGFDPARCDERRAGGLGIGLASVRQRIEASGGRLSVETAPCGGARVLATWRDDRGTGARGAEPA